MQGHILSIFYLPYGLAHIPTSMLMTRYGARRLYGLAMAMAAVVTLLIPVAANYSFILVVVIRGLIGMLTVIRIIELMSCTSFTEQYVPIMVSDK